MGPLQGIRIIEFAGLGPGPFCGMMLADHGADVIRVDRATGGDVEDAAHRILNRSRKSLRVDLKNAAGLELVRRLCRSADGLIEGFRPGVMERLGLGPDVLLADNPKLVYGRMTGWGQTGPYAQTAGHDINYIALSGALHACGRAGERPVAPLNLVGDFGGGGMMLAFGMVSALLHARIEGRGQVIDSAMTDGSAVLMSMIYSLRAAGLWRDERGVNLLDSGAPFYDTYETSDGKFIAIGAVEPQFYRELLERTGLCGDPVFAKQNDTRLWPQQKARLSAHFLTKTRREWCDLLEGTDACFAPVLSLDETATHPHNSARNTFVKVDGGMQPAPAPRYSLTPPEPPRANARDAETTNATLREIGYSLVEIGDLRETGIVR